MRNLLHFSKGGQGKSRIDQVPGVGASRSLIASISALLKRPPRKSPHRRRQSVQAPNCSPARTSHSSRL